MEENNPSFILQVNYEELWKMEMEGSYVSENGVRFDSKHSSTLDTSSKCRRMQDRVRRAMAEKIKKIQKKNGDH